ncbi:MAG: hypothetical protein VYE31_00595 [Pseudomonadota bacterium]|nr:hypothetical protein [Pseudomonadota bacterium]
MIYILLITILGIYLYLLLTNIGEEEKVKTNNLSKFFIIILLTVPLFFIYIPKSGIQDMGEYQRILDKNKNIREDITKIKKSIPKLEKKLQVDSGFYEGWIMLARSYSIIDNLNLSIGAYETAISLKSNNIAVLKEYLNVLKVDGGKRNKEKIINTYNKLFILDEKDTSMLLNKLHYSVKINDSELMIKTLNEIIDHPQIIDKDRYRKILTKITNN